MHPSSKAAFEFAAFEERCIMQGQAQKFIKQKWQMSVQMANLDSVVFIFVTLRDNKLAVVNIKPAKYVILDLYPSYGRPLSYYIVLCMLP